MIILFPRFTVPMLAVGWLLTAGLVGCDTAVNPIEKTNRAFSLYGYLDPKADTQAVRVFPLATKLRTTGADSIDAKVQSTEVETGRTYTWRDSLVQLENDAYRHVFWAPFAAKYGHTYRLEAIRSNGTTSSASISIPSEVHTEVTTINPRNPSFEVQIVPDSGAVSLMKPRLTYTTSTIPPTSFEEAVFMRETFTPYEQKTRRGDDRWTFRFNMKNHYEVIQDKYEASGVTNSYIKVRRLLIQFTVAASEWNSNIREMDPKVIAQPGTISNIENGFGFVSSAYSEAVRWKPSDEMLETAGFATCREPDC